MRTPIAVFFAALLLAAVTGCGQKGPLVLPPEDAPAAGFSAEPNG